MRDPPEAPAQAPPDALHLYLYGIEEPLLRSAMEPAGLASEVWPTDRLQEADAVLALRSKLTQVLTVTVRPHVTALLHHSVVHRSCLT